MKKVQPFHGPLQTRIGPYNTDIITHQELAALSNFVIRIISPGAVVPSAFQSGMVSLNATLSTFAPYPGNSDARKPAPPAGNCWPDDGTWRPVEEHSRRH